MKADDPRHGTVQAYNNLGCRCSPCRDDKARYERTRRHLRDSYGYTLLIDPTGTRRRIRALMRIGWRASDIAAVIGLPRGEYITELLKERPTMQRTKAATIKRAYDQLSMRPGPSDRTRNYAARKGWPSPLAWEDATIDDPNARPAGLEKTTYRHRDEIDEAAVIRAVGGERLTLTKAERAEVVRRLRAAHWPDRQIEMHTGLKADRYGEPCEEVAA